MTTYRLDILAKGKQEGVIPFRVLYLPAREPNDRYPTVTSEKPMVEFYDLRYRHTLDGQFVTRYYADTLRSHQGGITLDGGVPAWRIDADTFQSVVLPWLQRLPV